MMCFGAVFACVFMYILTKLRINMAIFTIGIDYMQVLSLLRKSKVSWPVALTTLLKMFHWFN